MTYLLRKLYQVDRTFRVSRSTASVLEDVSFDSNSFISASLSIIQYGLLLSIEPQTVTQTFFLLFSLTIVLWRPSRSN